LPLSHIKNESFWWPVFLVSLYGAFCISSKQEHQFSCKASRLLSGFRTGPSIRAKSRLVLMCIVGESEGQCVVW
jgi:hypothetical protein